MAESTVECFCTGGTKEHCAQQPEAAIIVPEELYGIMGAQCFKNSRVIHQVDATQYSQHGKPDKHDRSEQLTDGCCTKLLQKEEATEDYNNNDNDGIGFHAAKHRQFIQA